jgi:hypothetical protein
MIIGEGEGDNHDDEALYEVERKNQIPFPKRLFYIAGAEGDPDPLMFVEYRGSGIKRTLEDQVRAIKVEGGN